MYRALFFVNVIENQLHDQVKAILQADDEIEIVLAPRNGIDETQWNESNLNEYESRIHCVRPVLESSRWSLQKFALQLLRICWNYNIRLIDSHMGQSPESRATYLATRINRLPYIVSMYGGERNYLKDGAITPDDRRWLERVLRSAKLLLCHDKTLLEAAEKATGKKRNTYLLYNAIDPARAQRTIDRHEVRSKYDIPENAKVILFNHRIMAFKRPLVYVDALKLIKERFPNICFLFVGPKNEASNLGREIQKRLDEYGLRPDVRWVDRRVSGWEMDELYAISDVLVNVAELVVPSLSTLEAMSFGVPIVISDELDSELYVPANGDTGFIVPPQPQAVADAVARMLKDDEFRRQMGARAADRAAEYFDIKDWGKKVARCYRSVIFKEAIPS